MSRLGAWPNLRCMNESISRRRRRAQLIRGRVVAGAVALFVAVFGGITAQLASGHDPALATSKSKSATTTTTTTNTQQQEDTSLAPVTTRQS
jgi:small neutral amino acid transporter SnatA (MarC family)